MSKQLARLFLASAQRAPDAIAVIFDGEAVTYGSIDRDADRAASALIELGLKRGDRIAIWNEKTQLSISLMQGALRIGAVYVPIDPLSPAPRAEKIIRDCSVSVIATTSGRANQLPPIDARYLLLDHDGNGGQQPDRLFWAETGTYAHPPRYELTGDDELAYILYTSGSTGKPKGVCISHINALAFVEWSVKEFSFTASDVFSSHAPFHFDLSVLDLYAAFEIGGTVSLIPEAISFSPRALTNWLLNNPVSVWYSVPSALILMMEQSSLFETVPQGPRVVLFAGEPFPIKHLRNLRDGWKNSRLFNLYGPTETNVCTFHEVDTLQMDMMKPVPIGCACSGDRVWAQRLDGTIADVGEEGELYVDGPTVMLGYWGTPLQSGRIYPTGDIVRRLSPKCYEYVGRRDHMVKIRGFRIELGELESVLLSHPQVREAAAVVLGTGTEAKLLACIVSRGAGTPSLVSLKRYCSERLPHYMNIDSVHILMELPRTNNGKLDRIALSALVSEKN